MRRQLMCLVLGGSVLGSRAVAQSAGRDTEPLVRRLEARAGAVPALNRPVEVTIFWERGSSPRLLERMLSAAGFQATRQANGALAVQGRDGPATIRAVTQGDSTGAVVRGERPAVLRVIKALLAERRREESP
jgi:hypothetical protein